jgi:hypothetical protein
MKQLIAQTLLALLSIAAAQNPPDGPVVPVDEEGNLEYMTEEQAAALRETWTGNVVGGENFFDDEMFQNTEDKTGGVTGGTIGGIDPAPQPNTPEKAPVVLSPTEAPIISPTEAPTSTKRISDPDRSISEPSNNGDKGLQTQGIIWLALFLGITLVALAMFVHGRRRGHISMKW